MMEELVRIVSGTDSESPIETAEFLACHPIDVAEKINQRIHHKSIIASAAQHGRLDTFLILMDIPTLDITTYPNEQSLLYWAALNPSHEILSYLMSHPEILEKIADNTTLIHIAAYQGDLERVTELFDANPACANEFDTNGHCALFYAALKPHIFILNFLINARPYSDAHANSFKRGTGIHAYHAAGRASAARDIKTAIEQYECSIKHIHEITTKQIEDYDFLLRCCARLTYIHMEDDELKGVGQATALFDQYLAEATQLNEHPLSEEYHALIAQNEAYKGTLERSSLSASPFFPASKHPLIATQYGFICTDVADDGNCFFHAIYHEIASIDAFKSTIHSDTDLRDCAVNHIRTHADYYRSFIKESSVEQYLCLAQYDRFWADDILIHALAHALRFNLVILSTQNPAPTIIKHPHPLTSIYLLNIGNMHFQLLKKDEAVTPSKNMDILIAKTPYDSAFVSPGSVADHVFPVVSSVAKMGLLAAPGHSDIPTDSVDDDLKHVILSTNEF